LLVNIQRNAVIGGNFRLYQGCVISDPEPEIAVVVAINTIKVELLR
jgi:hypothetical protein